MEEQLEWKTIINTLAIVVPIITAALVAWIQKRKSPVDSAAISASTMSTMVTTIRNMSEELDEQRARMRQLEESMAQAEASCDEKIKSLEEEYKERSRRLHQAYKDRIESLKGRIRVLEQNGSKGHQDAL